MSLTHSKQIPKGSPTTAGHLLISNVLSFSASTIPLEVPKQQEALEVPGQQEDPSRGGHHPNEAHPQTR
ncbi:hypothetical protein Sjap_014364 [Stephania japonica]|uniref:Uncharacterized protein n=1 Tax=Stephania japonica TaxID=461633 RepID=A0AAP0NYK9_9MAGN